MISSFLSLHILADGCVEADINRAGRFLAACECEYYNLTTASRYNEAEKLIRLLHYQAPKARPIWRGWPTKELEDGGIWQRVKPQEWVNYRIAPNAKWLKELDVLVLPCNEVGVLGADTRKWSEWEADCARLSHIQFEISLAMLRLSTGNPLETEHENYNAQLQAAVEFDGILSPNEYTSTRMEITNRWHVGRYRWIWEQQDKLKIKRSPIVIGEYGIARVNGDNSLDPYHGYGDLGVNVNDHLSIIKRDGLTYQSDGVTVCWYVLGHWQEGKGSFDVHNNEPLLSTVEVEAKAGHLKMISPTLTMPKPTNAFSPLRVYIRNEIIVRSGASTAYPRIDTLTKGQQVTLYEPKAISSSDGSKWIYLEYSVDGLPKGGWINGASLSFTTTPPTVETPIVKPTPEVPAVNPDKPPVNAPDSTKPSTSANSENALDGLKTRNLAIVAQLKVIAGAINALITLLENEPIKELV